jgi:Flp pilus assembly protein TadD
MLAPGDGAVQDTLGFVLLQSGRSREGLQTLRRAASVLPDDPSVQFHLALALNELQDRAGALFHLEKSLGSGDFPEVMMAKKLLVHLNGEGAGIR